MFDFKRIKETEEQIRTAAYSASYKARAVLVELGDLLFAPGLCRAGSLDETVADLVKATDQLRPLIAEYQRLEAARREYFGETAPEPETVEPLETGAAQSGSLTR